MIIFFEKENKVSVVEIDHKIDSQEQLKLEWLFDGARFLNRDKVSAKFVGPRREMISPWSTNAVEITQNMGLTGITRIEEFFAVAENDSKFDPMLEELYSELNQEIFFIEQVQEPVILIDDIKAFNQKEALALSDEEVEYLEDLSKRLNRKLTDSEVFGFSQVNSEHCRHKIFNGTFIIDGEEQQMSLFQMIKKTSNVNPNRIVSAYKDNVAFVEGPEAEQFAPKTQDKADFFENKKIDTVLSLKAETHNFPTTVEPFNGAATGSGGEIRDRMAGGTGSIPMAGTAVYMTSYPRLENNRNWENNISEREWLYQTPQEILMKASNGASDFGNKFGQPLICGSLFTFEHFEGERKYGFDKVIMLAGGIGHARREYALKNNPKIGDKVVVMGGDNYRIGMGGGAVSSVDTGEFESKVELNAVQRSNPEMQKRVFNVVRALAEMDNNPLISIHDHGAGGHLNCLSELVETTGGKIDVSKLPVGDKTLSIKEIVGNESQERMGMLIDAKDQEMIERIAHRERAPFYVVGETTGDHRFTFWHPNEKINPIDLQLSDFFGNPPKTIMDDISVESNFEEISYDKNLINEYLLNVLKLEAVACKDWLTNKADRSVGGKVARQQTVGMIQLPLSNLGAMAIDFRGEKGIATSVGHSPATALIDSKTGSKMAITEALANIVWAPIEQNIKGVSLSANWMWPCRNEGEDVRLYEAVKAASDFACDLGLNIPTGKDSLSMTQKYPDGSQVVSPGTVIISAIGEVSDIKKIITPALEDIPGSEIIYVDFSKSKFGLGGSSFAQTLNFVGGDIPTIDDHKYVKTAFNTIQKLVEKKLVLAGHDVSSGGLITTLLEMMFPNNYIGIDADLSSIEGEDDLVKILFSEKPAVVLQINNDRAKEILREAGIIFHKIGNVTKKNKLILLHNEDKFSFDLFDTRDAWYETSYLFDAIQSTPELAMDRFDNYRNQELVFNFSENFKGSFESLGIDPDRKENSGIKAAIIREKGSNGDRETAYALWLAGFDVKDIHMTDLISGRENLEDVNMIVFVGGFSNSDVLGSAKGWAGAFLYNPKAKAALDNFYKRDDTLSLGICNGCQLMIELGLIYPQQTIRPKMARNDSNKFESGFYTLDIIPNNSVMLSSLEGSRLGVWVSHGEGKFVLPYAESDYNIPAKYSYSGYPGNPNGSPYNTAALTSHNGRHLAIMPHPERAIFTWQWAYIDSDKRNWQVTPWMEAFINAFHWVEKRK